MVTTRRGRRKLIREANDWKRIYKAMCEGDQEALRIMNRKKEIEQTINSLVMDSKKRTPLHNKNYIRVNYDLIFRLEKEKVSLLYEFNVPLRTAKIYLENLKIQKAKERQERSL